MSFADLLTQRAVISRFVTSTPAAVDSYGQPVGYWQDQTSTACQVQMSKRSNPSVVGVDYQAILSTHVGFMAYGVDIQDRDRITVSSTAYTVLFIGNPGARNHHLELQLGQVKA